MPDKEDKKVKVKRPRAAASPERIAARQRMHEEEVRRYLAGR